MISVPHPLKARTGSAEVPDNVQYNNLGDCLSPLRARGKYWDEISEKRKQRNEKRRNGQKITLTDYVLIQPPVYDRSTTPCNTLDGQTRQDSAVYFPDG